MTTWLSTHFSLAELVESQTATRQGLDNTPGPDELAALKRVALTLEMVRVRLGGFPIVISSGYRSPAVNRAVGGAPASQHMRGEAVDFTCPRFGPPKLVAFALAESIEIPYDQLILEFDRWVHLSVSDRPRRQALRVDRDGTRPLIGAR